MFAQIYQLTNWINASHENICLFMKMTPNNKNASLTNPKLQYIIGAESSN